MTEKDFVPGALNISRSEGKVIWKAPSNIALVKYWGKKPDQIPANPSISFTLNVCATTTTVTYNKLETKGDDFSFELYFDGKRKPDFIPKIKTFFGRIEKYVPFLKDYHLEISTSNSFPHSSGIASSASGMAALALCIMEIEKKMNSEITAEYFNLKASFLARLGSGSACRSVDGSIVQWGKHPSFKGSSDLYGVPYKIGVHPVFTDYQDTILLVDKGQKEVSSTSGHGLMKGHIFANQRFQQANENLNKLKEVFITGDLEGFIQLVESEALTLHAMMMTSIPYYVLMKPNTLKIIEHIWEFRKKSGLHLCFTLDAGANVHVLYPRSEREQVFEFIENELVVFCENRQYISDQIGNGAKKLC